MYTITTSLNQLGVSSYKNNYPFTTSKLIKITLYTLYFDLAFR